jgi:hypothetical protein
VLEPPKPKILDRTLYRARLKSFQERNALKALGHSAVTDWNYISESLQGRITQGTETSNTSYTYN